MGRDQGPFRAALCPRGPCGWGGLSLAPCCHLADVPLSVGVIEPQVLPSQLNSVEFYWDPTKRTSLFLQVSLKLGHRGGWKSDGGGSSLGGKAKGVWVGVERVGGRMNHFQNTP